MQSAMPSELKIDRSQREHDAEGMVILSGTIADERVRVHVASDVWVLVLDHFNVGRPDGPEQAPQAAYDALERIGDFVIARRGPPQYGVLFLSLG